MTDPVIIPNESTLNLVSEQKKEEIKKADIQITKAMIKRVCPNIASFSELFQATSKTNSINHFINKNNSNSNTKLSDDIDDIDNIDNVDQILNAIAVTNEIYWGTPLCSNMTEIRFHGLSKIMIKNLTENFNVIWPWSLQYDTIRLGNNKRFCRFPLMIVFPKSVDDVKFWIKFVQTYSFSVSIRSGGHNYEYYSGENSVIIDLTDLKLENKDSQIYIDKENGYVKVAPGVRLGILYNELDKHDSIIAGGICPSVATGGLVAGGGVGYMMRKLGFACDNLLSVKLILANGEKVKANENENKDLFKACKGAGQNFGVIVEYKLKIFPIKRVIYYTYVFSLNNFVSVMEIWQRFVQKAPADLASSVVNCAAGLDVFIINGIFSSQKIKGDDDCERSELSVCKANETMLLKFNELIKPEFLDKLKKENIKPVIKKIENLTFIEAESSIALEIPNLPFYKIKGNCFFEPIDNNGWKKINKILKQPLLEDPTQGFLAIQIIAYGGNLKKSNSVLVASKSIGLIQTAVYYSNQDNQNIALNLIEGVYDIIKSFTSSYSEPNIADKDLKNYLKDYYGKNIDFLKETKRKYDPDNLFKFSRSIPI